MAPSRTKTIKNKHAAGKSGVKGSKAARNPQFDSIVKSKKQAKSSKVPIPQIKGRPILSELLKKRKKKVYSEKELDIPKLNMITPVGVQKPKGKKKGKVFVDDPESMNTILAMVQAEKEGQIESKMIKARQMEEIREARRIEAEKKEEERKARLDETKESLRKKRKRTRSSDAATAAADDIDDVDEAAAGKAAKAKKKKRVSFAQD